MRFEFKTAGESHGKALVAIVEGIPAGLEIDSSLIDSELQRRQMGYGRSARMKIENDSAEIVSGVRHGRSLGSPVALIIENRDFEHWRDVMSVSGSPGSGSGARKVTRPRPGHADLAGGMKYQARDLRDILERASARETAARVAAGALAKILLAEFGVEIASHVLRIGSEPGEILESSWDEIASVRTSSVLRCTDSTLEKKMIAQIDAAKESGDTLGGIYEVVGRGVPVGLGAHTSWNEKLDGQFARAIMSIPATKAVEIGTGVANASRKGSEVHDEIFYEDGFSRSTNRAGGLEGGITNGEEIRIRGYMKPISTLRKRLRSVNIEDKKEESAAFERSDITAVPAAGVIAEAMVALVVADAMRRKFGGDSLAEMKANFSSYISSLKSY